MAQELELYYLRHLMADSMEEMSPWQTRIISLSRDSKFLRVVGSANSPGFQFEGQYVEVKDSALQVSMSHCDP